MVLNCKCGPFESREQEAFHVAESNAKLLDVLPVIIAGGFSVTKLEHNLLNNIFPLH